ncbi:GPI transamidase subunit PIG-U [Babesia ovis]|uniref:GPI transamidase subunit PIG-U n=1 Tax=Babesia ovis TaxID=5869 RepID=A0A9W5T8L7_BABOV|nr:GPI transamidase subunit PIG-U [Babesia ovis]
MFFLLVFIRALLQLGVGCISPSLPFFIIRDSRDVLEYLALHDAGILDKFEGRYHLVYSLVYYLRDKCSNVDILDLTKVLIFCIDVVSAWFWYRTVALIPAANLSKNRHVEGYGFVTSPLFISGLHLLNPISVLYNEATNCAGCQYFWASFAIYAAVKLNTLNRPSAIVYFLYQFAATGLMTTSFKMYLALPALTMLAVHRRFNFGAQSSINRDDLKRLCRYIIPHMILTASLVLLGHSNLLHELKHRVVNEYTGRGTGIDYSIYWYIHRVVPTEFQVGNILKSQMVVFLLPIPLVVMLRLRPLECVITSLSIAIMQDTSLSLLGIWYIVCLFAVHYPMMDKCFGFTKMMTLAFAAMIFSVMAYICWVGRYIANPNYFFAPQLIILVIICMVLEDYTSANVQLSNSGIHSEKCR